jgi:hypothetical protein
MKCPIVESGKEYSNCYPKSIFARLNAESGAIKTEAPISLTPGFNRVAEASAALIHLTVLTGSLTAGHARASGANESGPGFEGSQEEMPDGFEQLFEMGLGDERAGPGL